MFEKASQAYFGNLKKLIPVILLEFIVWAITVALGVIVTGVMYSQLDVGIDETISYYLDYDGTISIALIIIFIVSGLLSVATTCFGNIVIKKIVREEEIDYKECFIEGLRFYFRYIILTIVIALIMFGISLLTGVLVLIPVLGILIFLGSFIFIIYLSITLSPPEQMIFYMDCSAMEALSEGRKVGKQNFWGILGVNMLVGIISSIIGLMTMVSDSIIVLSIIAIVGMLLSKFYMVYNMVICKEYCESNSTEVI